VVWQQSSPDERPHDEPDGGRGKDERNGDESDDRHDRLKDEPGQPLYDGLQVQRVIVTVLQEALDITSSSLSPHISVMQPADAGERYHFRLRRRPRCHLSAVRRVPLESQTAAVLGVVADVRVDEPDEMLLAQNYNVVKQLAT